MFFIYKQIKAIHRKLILEKQNKNPKSSDFENTRFSATHLYRVFSTSCNNISVSYTFHLQILLFWTQTYFMINENSIWLQITQEIKKTKWLNSVLCSLKILETFTQKKKTKTKKRGGGESKKWVELLNLKFLKYCTGEADSKLDLLDKTKITCIEPKIKPDFFVLWNRCYYTFYLHYVSHTCRYVEKSFGNPRNVFKWRRQVFHYHI